MVRPPKSDGGYQSMTTKVESPLKVVVGGLGFEGTVAARMVKVVE